MFDSLAEKLQATLADVRGRGTLTEDDVTAAMREIRLALLEADVNFKVVKQFTNAVRERALGSDVIGQLNPGHQLVKIGAQAGADVYEQGTDRDPVEIAKWARERAEQEGKDVLIVDTAGRLHV